MITKRQIEKTTVYLLLSLFIQFSAIEIKSDESFPTQSLW